MKVRLMVMVRFAGIHLPSLVQEFKLQMTTDGFPVRKMTSKGKAVPRLLKLSADFDVLSW